MTPLREGIIAVPVERLVTVLGNPFVTPPWPGCAPFTAEDVRAVVSFRGEPPPVPIDGHRSRDWHIRQIAYLLVHGWDSEHEVPHLDVGVPSLSAAYLAHHAGLAGPVGALWLTDGNHRFAAAIVARRPTFYLTVSGDLDLAEKLLDVVIP